MQQRKSVCLVAGGMVEDNLRLQPWRYLYEVAYGLVEHGHKVTIISDGEADIHGSEFLSRIPIIRLNSIRNPLWRRNSALQGSFVQLAPDVILWHVGLLSFLHQRLLGPPDTPIIGIFTSPIYNLSDLTHLGIGKLISSFHMAAYHILGSLVPRSFLRRFINVSHIQHLVVETETTHSQLLEQGLWMGGIQVIPPGVDLDWRRSPGKKNCFLRKSLGYEPEDVIIVFFGSPAPLRGLPSLVQGFTIARRKNANLKLLILCRRHPGELHWESVALKRAVSDSQFQQHIHILDGYLNQDDLIQHVLAADIVALPFKLVPSDAPLSILEAAALGKPLVTTRVACLPELVANNDHYLADPSSPVSLAKALLQAGQNPHKKKSVSSENQTSSWVDTSEKWSRVVMTL